MQKRKNVKQSDCPSDTAHPAVEMLFQQKRIEKKCERKQGTKQGRGAVDEFLNGMFVHTWNGGDNRDEGETNNKRKCLNEFMRACEMHIDAVK